MEVSAKEAHQSANHHKFSTDSRLYQWHLQAFMKQVEDLLRQSEAVRVLDAGCGEGFVTGYLIGQNPDWQFTGVDLNPDAVSYAQNHYGTKAHFQKGSLYKLPFSDHAFDTVLCSEVLEHLDDPDRAINELKRVARRYVLITVPREPYFKWFNDLGRSLGISPDPGHVNFWTKQTFQTLIQRHFETATFTTKHYYQLALAMV